MKKLILLLLFPVIVFGFGSLIQKQIDTITPPSGSLTLKDTVVFDSGTASRVHYLNVSKELTASDIDPVELSYLDGATQNINAALDNLETNIFTASQDLQSQIDLATQDIADNTTLIATTSQDLQTNIDNKEDSITILPIAKGGTGSATQNFIDLTSTQSVGGDKTFSGETEFSNNTSVLISRGTTGERNSSPLNGMFRYNSTENEFEGYADGAWGAIAGGGGGDGATTTLNNLGGVLTPAEFSQYSDTPTGAGSLVTIDADNSGTVGNSITVTGASSGGGGLEADYNATGAEDSGNFLADLDDEMAVIFSPSTSYSFNKASIRVRDLNDGGSSIVTAVLRNANSGGSHLPVTGSPIAVSTTFITTDDLPTSFAYVDFDFPSTALTSGNWYAVSIKVSSGSHTVGDIYAQTSVSDTAETGSTVGTCSSSCDSSGNWGTAGNFSRFQVHSAGGNKDVDTLISEWNISNPSNTATVALGGAEAPDVGIVLSLTGGVDAITTEVAINKDLLPDTNSTLDLGTALLEWDDLFVQRITVSENIFSGKLQLEDLTNTGIGAELAVNANQFSIIAQSPNDLLLSTGVGTSNDTKDVIVQSGVSIGASFKSGDVSLYSGNANVSTGTSGDLNLSTGAGNTKGDINILEPIQMSQASTPTASDSLKNKLYFKDDNKLYMMDSATQETLVSSVMNTENISDWVSFTPSFTNSVSAVSVGRWRRVGDSMEIEASFHSATGSASPLILDLPNSELINLTKISDGNQNILGHGIRNAGANTYVGVTGIYYAHSDKTDTNSIFFGKGSSADMVNAKSQSNDIDFNNGFAVRITVPIDGWESSTKYAIGTCEGLSCFNTFSARSTNLGIITSESLDFINGDCVLSATSTYTCAFTTDLFLVAPSCVATSEDNGEAVSVVGVSNTSLTIIGYNNAGSLSTQGWHVNCHRQGADFFDNDSRLIPINDQENVFSARINNSGSATIANENSSFIQSVNRISVGYVQVNFKTDFFSQIPSIVMTPIDNSGNRSADVENGTTSITSFRYYTTSDTGVLFDTDAHFIVQKQGIDYSPPKAFVGNINPQGFIKTEGVAEPRIESAHVSINGVVSDEVGDLFNGNCTNAIPMVCTYATPFLSIPNCVLTSRNDNVNMIISVETTTQITVFGNVTSSLTNGKYPHNILCHGE